MRELSTMYLYQYLDNLSFSYSATFIALGTTNPMLTKIQLGQNLESGFQREEFCLTTKIQP